MSMTAAIPAEENDLVDQLEAALEIERNLCQDAENDLQEERRLRQEAEKAANDLQRQVDDLLSELETSRQAEIEEAKERERLEGILEDIREALG